MRKNREGMRNMGGMKRKNRTEEGREEYNIITPYVNTIHKLKQNQPSYL
jgi:hypothetical protein